MTTSPSLDDDVSGPDDDGSAPDADTSWADDDVLRSGGDRDQPG
ncbi:hypothetical protein [Sorangium sp. So ce1000]